MWAMTCTLVKSALSAAERTVACGQVGAGIVLRLAHASRLGPASGFLGPLVFDGGERQMNPGAVRIVSEISKENLLLRFWDLRLTAHRHVWDCLTIEGG